MDDDEFHDGVLRNATTGKLPFVIAELNRLGL